VPQLAPRTAARAEQPVPRRVVGERALRARVGIRHQHRNRPPTRAASRRAFRGLAAHQRQAAWGRDSQEAGHRTHRERVAHQRAGILEGHRKDIRGERRTLREVGRILGARRVGSLGAHQWAGILEGHRKDIRGAVRRGNPEGHRSLQVLLAVDNPEASDTDNRVVVEAVERLRGQVARRHRLHPWDRSHRPVAGRRWKTRPATRRRLHQTRRGNRTHRGQPQEHHLGPLPSVRYLVSRHCAPSSERLCRTSCT